MVETASGGATANDAFPSSSIGDLEEAIAAKRAAAVAAEPGLRLAGLRSRVAKLEANLELAKADVANEEKAQGTA